MEFGVVPVGERIHPNELNDRSQQSKMILSDILAVLVWLHEQHIIHRDVRWDNIVELNNHGYLINFGSTILTNSPKKRKYAGGYICCPPRILNSKRGLEEEYIPNKLTTTTHTFCWSTHLFSLPALQGLNHVGLNNLTAMKCRGCKVCGAN
ncbi:hypothetical protein BDD12DRAFT_332451 [Trichophaea hybrida]|nr:hypothetical protein BDD12DRAFT_332451 [Trichophaea hybrida]